ncbi:carbohydrate ABC transporter permease [Butyrivibrio sp. INlla21]|uniref:carbohydrate ABC transporter permease n=1 Tax=Butyrivibrio sp. INlla21 TaxID=1520811 RepID=UPI0008F2D9B9|nr:carbohydrate ABC transporter permease [Butyrivibrio sp. INlla21]SFV00069.1 raffinose/stachyose/melibiose transport system permease protein [Butyrivibrio sp. INlla21]
MLYYSKPLKTFLNVITVLFCVLYLFPIYLILTNSFKSRSQMYENMVSLPKSLSLQYYMSALEKMNFFTSLKNSLILTVISITVIVIFASMTAWMFVRSNNKLSVVLFDILVATMLIPFQTIMMPLMQEMNWFGFTLGIKMTDTIPGLIFMYLGFGAGMGVFLYHGFISSIPVSLEEAATIDGCNTWKTFWQIVFPMLKPTTMTVIILDVIWIWNDYLLPSLTLKSTANRTIPISTAKFFGQYTISWNEAMAALVVTIIPVVIFYLACQKYIVEGVAAGAVKG